MRQGWDQTLIEDSSPILHCKSCLTTTRDAWILCIKLGVWPKLVSKKFPIGKYLALNTCVIRVSWFVINFQPYFLSMARLKACKCLKPIPPNSFFIVIFSQLSELIPFLRLFFWTPAKRNSSFSTTHLLKWMKQKDICNMKEYFEHLT